MTSKEGFFRLSLNCYKIKKTTQRHIKKHICNLSSVIYQMLLGSHYLYVRPSYSQIHD